jgi:hypothetical protein
MTCSGVGMGTLRSTEPMEPQTGFLVPRSMTPLELGDSVARLVWENFSDFIAEGGAEAILRDLDRPVSDGMPDANAAEEILIFFMWAHTRGVQLAFVGRAPEDRLRATLDALHRAIFEDMAAHGTPGSQLPIFEQRVGARYAEYYAAAAVSDARVGEVALQHIAGSSNPELGWSLTERAIVAASPLKDYLDDVELVAA